MSTQNDQVTPAETAEILKIAQNCLKIPGDFVEFGCYRGETSIPLAKLLQNPPVDNLGKTSPDLWKTSTKPVYNFSTPLVDKSSTLPTKNQKRLWLYDSFAGLPEKSPEDSSAAGQNFQSGALFVTKREVSEKLKRYNLHNVIIKKAWFDALTPSDLPPKIAFAFLDGDLYNSIKTSLRLVLPRLAEQGIIIVHDYNNPELPGATRAVDEFLRAQPNFRLSQKHTLAIIVK